MDQQITTSQLQNMRNYFQTGATKSYAFRKAQLQKLKACLLANEEALNAALYADLKKSKEEVWVTETGFLLSELNATISALQTWMRPESKWTNMLNMPGSSAVHKEPLGVVLIIGPWNYPLQLLFTPLVGAIAAGNCVVLKASEFAPATCLVMQKMIAETFAENHVRFMQGDGATVVPQMMDNFIFDHVFYTGSTAVGKLIYQMAAKNLVPVTLELGGKSPCVIESDANVQVAAKRIVTTKFSNCGQMCVAPDYVLVHSSQKDAFVAAMKKTIVQFLGEDPTVSYDYGKIINERQFDRLSKYLTQGTIVHGGKTDKATLYFEPTLMENVSLDDAIMKEEIFGPILPIIAYETNAEAKQIIARNPNPLAFYVFTQSRAKEKEWIQDVPFGGGCINNASYHLTNHELPFGGRGFSGTGQYHGKYSFETFSHRKAILKTATWFNPAIKYPSLKGNLKLFKWIIR
jgi:aldehyde dehydrogenase (NAD+)